MSFCRSCKYYDEQHQICYETDEWISPFDCCGKYRKAGKVVMRDKHYDCDVCKKYGRCRNANDNGCNDFELSKTLLQEKQHQEYLLQEKIKTCPFIEHGAQK